MKLEVKQKASANWIPTCLYCEQDIDGEFIEIVSDVLSHEWHDSVPYLHRNCVVAFATRILNEFEKL